MRSYLSEYRTNKRFPKKSNIIAFVGKLNRSKGFHIFGSAIIKI